MSVQRMPESLAKLFEVVVNQAALANADLRGGCTRAPGSGGHAAPWNVLVWVGEDLLLASR